MSEEEQVEILMESSKSALQPMLDSRDRSLPSESYARIGGRRLSELGVKGRKQLPFSDVLECFVFLRYLWVERDVRGGGWLLRAYNRELKDLSFEDKEDFAQEFLKLVFSEDAEKKAYFVNGVIRNQPNKFPDDLIEFNGQWTQTPDWLLKVNSEMDIQDNLTSQNRMEVTDKVSKSFDIGLVADRKRNATNGLGREEARDLLKVLEGNIILSKVLPWGSLAAGGPSNMDSKKATDFEEYGPWMFTRPGEYFFEHILFKDTVGPQYKSILTGDLLEEYVAVVGVVKAVHCGNEIGGNIKTQQLVGFDARDFDKVASEVNVRMDSGIPTMTQQVLNWMNEEELDKLRSQGVRYSKFDLMHGDIYFIPRNVIHQAEGLSAATYITWNLRLKEHLLE